MMPKNILIGGNFGKPFISAALAFLIISDSIVILNGAQDPILSGLSCAILPFAKISSLFISSKFLNLASEQCASFQIHESSLSIIFFMFKMSVTLIFFVLPLSFLAFIKSITQIRSQKIINIKNEIITLSTLLLFCFYLLLTRSTPTGNFKTDIFSKFIEDFLCILILIIVPSLVSYIWPLISWFMKLAKRSSIQQKLDGGRNGIRK